MATSAFKSSTRRDAAGLSRAPPPSRRRSHSVSAASRKTHLPNEESGSISSEYSNSRDNPLFWDKEANDKVSSTGSKVNQLNSASRRSTATSSGYVSEERGRAVARNGSVKRGIGRSLSRGPKDVVASRINGVKPTSNSVERPNSSRSTVNGQRRVENSRLRKTPNRSTELSEDDSACSLQVSNLEDEISSICFSEVEEKTIEAFCEDLNIRHDFSRDHVDTVKALNVADIPPDLVNPGAVELISDIRREYAVKLEQSEERARKLRADLAIEEQRGQELDKILKDILPDPKGSNTQRSRKGRRRSNERKKMSKRLNEEALTYFDECVSLSTFDSSDFSAPEDPTFISSGATFPVGASALGNGKPSTIYCYDQDSGIHQKEKFDNHVQPPYSWEDPRTTINNIVSESEHSLQYQFSFAEQPPQNVEHHEDNISFIKHFEKSTVKDTDRSYYDPEEYGMYSNIESMLLDRVSFNKRQNSGHLMLCGGATSFLPFASVW